MLRQEGANLRPYALISGLAAHALAETGAVVVENVGYTLLELGGGAHRSVHGEVAALRVSADPQHAVKSPAGTLQIRGGIHLRRDGVVRAHVEVLAPGGYGVVGAAEGHKVRAVGHTHGQGAELLRANVVYVIDVVVQHHAGEAL